MTPYEPRSLLLDEREYWYCEFVLATLRGTGGCAGTNLGVCWYQAEILENVHTEARVLYACYMVLVCARMARKCAQIRV
eukprot:874035-Rhodomonas_salina.2